MAGALAGGFADTAIAVSVIYHPWTVISFLANGRDRPPSKKDRPWKEDPIGTENPQFGDAP